jgi:hypothetical protein
MTSEDIIRRWLEASANWKCQDVRSLLYISVEVPVAFLKRYLDRQVVLPVSPPEAEAPGIAIPVDLTLGTPLLGWYLRLNEEGIA